MKIENISIDEYKRRTKYWNRYHEAECVLCMKTDVDIERVLESVEPRPKEWSKRHIIYETACMNHFI